MRQKQSVEGSQDLEPALQETNVTYVDHGFPMASLGSDRWMFMDVPSLC